MGVDSGSVRGAAAGDPRAPRDRRGPLGRCRRRSVTRDVPHDCRASGAAALQYITAYRSSRPAASRRAVAHISGRGGRSITPADQHPPARHGRRARHLRRRGAVLLAMPPRVRRRRYGAHHAGHCLHRHRGFDCGHHPARREQRALVWLLETARRGRAPVRSLRESQSFRHLGGDGVSGDLRLSPRASAAPPRGTADRAALRHGRQTARVDPDLVGGSRVSADGGDAAVDVAIGPHRLDRRVRHQQLALTRPLYAVHPALEIPSSRAAGRRDPVVRQFRCLVGPRGSDDRQRAGGPRTPGHLARCGATDSRFSSHRYRHGHIRRGHHGVSDGRTWLHDRPGA